MVKGPVQIEGRDSIELDGCLKCGSLWFDNREIEPFFPEIQDLGLFPEYIPLKGKGLDDKVRDNDFWDAHGGRDESVVWAACAVGLCLPSRPDPGS